ncbi:MAG: response regulator [Candidatus Omnitrophica bacterium]|nr:response regulator [Candidatus Omnitrophota bacterium]
MAKKILIVDDEPDVLKMEVFRVKKMGHEVFTATNGQEALEMIRDKKPDLVLLDVRLPGMMGTEVCSRVKNDEILKAIPVILVTASSETVAGKKEECKADDYILKPFEVEELIQKITKFLGT